MHASLSLSLSLSIYKYLSVLARVHRKSNCVVETLADEINGRALEEVAEGAGATRGVVLVKCHDPHPNPACHTHLSRREESIRNIYIYVYAYLSIHVLG